MRGVAYVAMTIALTVLVGSGIIDNRTEVDIWGVSTDRARSAGGGYELEVRYATVTRPALATPFDIIVRRDDGFTQPIEIAVDPRYLEMWDFQALYPQPSGETATKNEVTFTFDAPEGNVLRVFLDARIQPAQQSGRSGFVAVLDDRGNRAATVTFQTTVRP